MENRVCIFVDGENLRFSINDLFSPRYFKKSDHVPIKADWGAWFDNLAQKSVVVGEARRTRTYWFVTESVRFYPPLIHFQMNEAERLAWLTRNADSISKSKFIEKPRKEELKSGIDDEKLAALQRITDGLKGRKGRIGNQFYSNHHLQNQIAEKNRAVEFCRSGEINYDLFRRKYGQEKTVDVNLALAMVLRVPIYDTAVIVSGDQDYVPAVQQVKNLGKHVVNVSFEAQDGRLLPGGAKKLNEVTDWSLQIPFAEFQTALGLTEEIPQEEQKQTNA